jgi:hypothetical protein
MQHTSDKVTAYKIFIAIPQESDLLKEYALPIYM